MKGHSVPLKHIAHSELRLEKSYAACVKIECLQPDLRRAVTLTSNGPAAVKRAVMAVVVASGTVSAGDVIRIVERKRGGRRGLYPV